MAGQSIERREILRYIGIASVAATFPGFSKWTFACAQDHIHAAPSAAAHSATNAAPYKRLFFSVDQFQMIEHLADMIIPADDSPGAKEAGVAEFIDFMLANQVPVAANRDIRSTADALEIGTEAQNQFILGLDWLNARSQSEFSKAFIDATPDQRHALLEELAYKSKFKPGTESGRAFFQLMRDYTVIGYYTTKIGLESIGYPGLRVVWPSAQGCSHPNDPEHAHLYTPANAAPLAFSGGK